MELLKYIEASNRIIDEINAGCEIKKKTFCFFPWTGCICIDFRCVSLKDFEQLEFHWSVEIIWDVPIPAPSIDDTRICERNINCDCNFISKVFFRTQNYRGQGQLLSLTIASIESFAKKRSSNVNSWSPIIIIIIIINLFMHRSHLLCFDILQFAINMTYPTILNGIKLIINNKWTGNHFKQLEKKVQQFHFQLGMK